MALVGRYDDDGSSELSVDEFNALVVSILQLQEQESAAAVTLQARRRGMSARRLSSELGARALDGALAAPHFTNLAPTDDGSLAYSELKASNLRLTDLAADLSAKGARIALVTTAATKAKGDAPLITPLVAA